MRLIDAYAIKVEIQNICDDCWHPYRLGDCPEHCGINDAVKAIDSAPTVDAVPVRHGHWTDDTGIEGAWNYCSVCGEQAIDLYDYCPNCGARMDGKDGGNGRS